jgi:hypothetical protein
LHAAIPGLAEKGLLDIEEMTFDWVNRYSNARPQSFFGNIPPEEYERNKYAQNIGASPSDAPTKRRHEKRRSSL